MGRQKSLLFDKAVELGYDANTAGGICWDMEVAGDVTSPSYLSVADLGVV